MPLQLSSPITDIPRIGPTKAKYLAKLGITHARDFLYTFPRRHDDFSTITQIADLKPGQTLTVKGQVKKVSSNWGWRGRRRMLRIFVVIEDDTGVLSVTWYNLQFLQKQLWKGRELYVAGKVEEVPLSLNRERARVRVKTQPKDPHPQPFSLSREKGEERKLRMRSPVIEFVNAEQENTHTGRITPVYPETYGVSSRFLRYQVKNLMPLIQAVPEYLPPAIIKRQKLIGIHQAIQTIHFPDSSERLEKARARLRFDELFFLQLAAEVRRAERAAQSAPAVSSKPALLKKFIASLPYKLTNAQQVALDEIVGDISKSAPMNRLLQGDVGSGKTVVAAAAIHLTLQAGHSALYLAPTEVLARQQVEALAQLLGKDNVELLIGAMRTVEKNQVKERLASADPVCVIGTHAIIQQDVQSDHLALVVVDEQHRFGVKQRKALLGVSAAQLIPHLLSMTATPIPRTLNLTVFGDLDVSVINELPPGRQPITTTIVEPNNHDQAILHILEELHAGRQAYVIAPLVEQSDKLQVKSAKETVVEMQRLFPDIAVGLLHGQMTSDEKKTALSNFSAGSLQLLVATSIVEVGVDVPNATIMIIEGAERFGLAQLHQFRGRVGRSSHKSYCYLFPTAASADNARLKVLASTTDGFIIAEEDLKLRGPGEVYGTKQSGFGHLQIASLLDYPTIKAARLEAQQLLTTDPKLTKYPILRKKTAQKNLVAHFE